MMAGHLHAVSLQEPDLDTPQSTHFFWRIQLLPYCSDPQGFLYTKVDQNSHSVTSQPTADKTYLVHGEMVA